LEAFEQAPPDNPSVLWAKIRPLFEPGLVREPTRLWKSDVQLSDEVLRRSAADLWDALKSNFLESESVDRALFFDFCVRNSRVVHFFSTIHIRCVRGA
jgi:hypothetical protein